MKKSNDNYCLILRDKERQCIEDQVKAYLNNGGKIEILNSVFDQQQDPKCRLGDDISIFA